MSATMEGRLSLILTDLRLPTVKRLALDLCAQSDHEGWPGNRLLEALFEHEINDRDVRRIEPRLRELYFADAIPHHRSSPSHH